MNSILAAVVNGMLVSAALAIAVWIALRLAPARWLNAATRYAIWWTVLVITVALPVSYFRGSAAGNAVETLAVSPASAAASSAMAPLLADSRQQTTMATNSSNVRRLRRVENRPVFPIAAPAGVVAGTRILTIWLAVSALLLIRLAASAVMLELRKARASEAPPNLAAQVPNWLTSCGGSGRFVRLGISNEISGPLLAGLRRASILLPARLLNELSACELEQIGIHEAAHVVRFDDWALLIERVLEALFALHPVVLWVSRQIDLEREIACDDFVIAATGESRPYAACLARVVEISGGVRALPAAAAAAEDRSHLARRVEMLLDDSRNRRAGLTWMRLTIAAAGVAMLAWGAARTPGAVEFVQPQQNPIAPPVVKPIENIVVPIPARIESAALAQAAPPVVADSPPQAAPLPPPVVFVPVEVRDPMGRYVTGLDRDVFRVEEDGVEQMVTSISRAGEGTDAVVLADPRLGPAATAIDFKAANVVMASTDISLQSILATGRMMDGDSDVRKAMLILTAKSTSLQSFTEDDVRSAAGKLTMPVYAIEVSDSAGLGRTMLAELARLTGGQHFVIARVEDLPDAVSQVSIALRNLYFVGYSPSNARRDGGYRTVDVSVRAPQGLPPLSVRSRPGYAAGR